MAVFTAENFLNCCGRTHDKVYNFVTLIFNIKHSEVQVNRT
jgi:hypothetical protein